MYCTLHLFTLSNSKCFTIKNKEFNRKSEKKKKKKRIDRETALLKSTEFLIPYLVNIKVRLKT